MRRRVDLSRLKELMQRLGREAKGPGSIYFTGGATMLLLGIRDQTIDVDLKMDPEPPGVFEVIARLKDELELNIELASPDDFLPALPRWREQSLPINTFGQVSFYHYDLRAQALAKLERGHDQDLKDVKALLERQAVSAADLWTAFEEMKPLLIRYPAIEADEFEKKIRRFPSIMPDQ